MSSPRAMRPFSPSAPFGPPPSPVFCGFALARNEVILGLSALRWDSLLVPPCVSSHSAAALRTARAPIEMKAQSPDIDRFFGHFASV